MELTYNDLAEVKTLVDYLLDEEDDFISWIGDGEGKPVDGVAEEDWNKEVDLMWDLHENRFQDNNFNAYAEQLSELATITAGHIYCNVVRVQDKLGL